MFSWISDVQSSCVIMCLQLVSAESLTLSVWTQLTNMWNKNTITNITVDPMDYQCVFLPDVIAACGRKWKRRWNDRCWLWDWDQPLALALALAIHGSVRGQGFVALLCIPTVKHERFVGHSAQSNKVVNQNNHVDWPWWLWCIEFNTIYTTLV